MSILFYVASGLMFALAAYKIKWLLKHTDLTCREIAKMFATTRNAVKLISRGVSWTHIPEPEEIIL